MDDTEPRDVAAIRLGILRRLAPGLRHRLMGELQSLQFSSELAARLLDSGGDAARMAASVRQIPPLARSCAAACSTLIEWLRTDEQATTTLDPALADLVHLAGDDWTLRGIESSIDVRTGDALVGRAAFRELVVLSLFALADEQSGPLDVTVAATREGEAVLLRLAATRSDRATHLPELRRAEPFGAADVRGLAAAYDVACTCARASVTLRLPVRASPAAGSA